MRDQKIFLPSHQFTDGKANKIEHTFGKGLLVDGGERKSHLRWEFRCETAGLYYLVSVYASMDHRPVDLFLNGKLIKTKGLNRVTGGWTVSQVQKYLECMVPLEAGLHQLELKTEHCIPHLKEFHFVPQNGDSKLLLEDSFFEKFRKKCVLNPYQDPAPGLLRRFVSNVALQGWKETFLKAGKYLQPSSFFRREFADVLGVYTKTQTFTGPNLVQIDITNNCNNDCVGCWCHSPMLEEKGMPLSLKKQFIPYERMVEILEELKGLGCREIYYAGGGDPSIHPEVIRILQKTKSLGMVAYVNTNFTLFTKTMIHECVDMGLDHFTLSVWAGSVKSYLDTHPNKTEKDYYALKENIHYLNSVKHGAPYTKVYHVISSRNYYDFHKMLNFALETGSDSVEFTMVDIVEGKTDSLLLNQKQLEDLRRDAHELWKRYQTTDLKKKIVLFRYEEFLRRIREDEDVKTGNYDKNIIRKLPCTIGWTFSRINADGSVNGCLKSHRIPVGNIYKNKFTEIWTGEKQKDFRKHTLEMKEGDPFFRMIGNDPTVEMGCYKSCDDIGRNQSMQRKMRAIPWWGKLLLRGIALPYRLGKKQSALIEQKKETTKDPVLAGFLDGHKVFAGPEQVVIDLTNFCASECVTCFTKSPLLKEGRPEEAWFKHKLDPKKLESLLHDLKDMGTKQIRFSGGGDPLFYPNLGAIVKLCKTLDFYVAITTNVYGSRPGLMDELIEASVDEICVSLMSGTAEIYETMHPGTTQKDFENIQDQIRKLVSAENIKVILCQVICNKNYQEIVTMAKLAASLNVSGFYYTMVDPVKGELESLLLTPKEAREALSLCDSLEKMRVAKECPPIDNFDIFKARLKSQTHDQASRGSYETSHLGKAPCSVGWHFSRILANGNVAPCCKGANHPVGNLKNTSFKEIWKGEKYTEFRSKAKHLSKSNDFFKSFECFKSCDNFQHNLEFYQQKILSKKDQS
jgi:MoaA/NifB/PqqE/SkfB family radical SAM enzyme